MARVFTFLATGRGKEREVSQPGVVAMATRTAGPDTEQGGDNAGEVLALTWHFSLPFGDVSRWVKIILSFLSSETSLLNRPARKPQPCAESGRVWVCSCL